MVEDAIKGGNKVVYFGMECGASIIRLFPYTKPRKNHAQQIVRREFSGDAAEPFLRQAQLFGKQFQLLIAALMGGGRMFGGAIEVIAGALERDHVTFARQIRRLGGLPPSGYAQ